MPSRTISTVVVVGAVLWVLFALLLSWHGGQEQKQVSEPPASQSTVSEVTTSGIVTYEFVGYVEGTSTLIAVVADTSVTASSDKKSLENTNKTVAQSTGETTAASGGERKVQAYVCDGQPQGTAEWFAGQMSGNTLELTSVSGNARLQAVLSEEEATGTVALADGTLRRFAASAAHEGAGLYEVIVGSDGRRSGTSANGAKDEAQVSSDGVWTAGTIRLPSGEAVDYRRRQTAGYQGGAKPDTYTTIVLPGAERERGRGGEVKTGEPSSNFISSDLYL
jgi:FlaG/FlaF family flagellin (archaellin)